MIHVYPSPVRSPPPLQEANSNITTPTAPGYTFLYSANASITDGIDFGTSPYNHRIVYPITGGEFNGPNLTGTFLNLGADWGYNDLNGNFHPDTRYNMLTHDGANIFIQTSGPTQSDGRIVLRILFETGHPKYYWLNNIVAIVSCTDRMMRTTSSSMPVR
ncbi:hypothetical protein F5883DRAFT_423234 [Diaporthe sp. PMI_573]|nr:hypothetical protein F5883DRAFT_423234 [Diaporthaceae sp. PMI_573]